MNTSFRALLLLGSAALVLAACSRKKDTFVNRNFHAMGTKYNVLYNGNLALEKGREAINDAYTDNYWDLLQVERMQVSEEIVLPGQTKNQDFERAEEKAIKAVQKHGMNIGGKEKNPQIDEAYLLLGKARYFDQRFVPALEAFNYILYKYPASDKINTAKVWREKTNIRLENNELAIENLKRLIDQEELSNQDMADATAMLAQAYINIKAKDSALTQLSIAAQATKKNNEKARFNYIRGQLYNEFGYKDSANIAFDQVIDLHRKIPRAYYINAHLAKANNFDYENGNKLEFLEYLTSLEEDRENRPFQDKIYHQIAKYHSQNQSDTLAQIYYNKSLRTNTTDRRLRALNYNVLGDMSFDNTQYRLAGAYYDSTMTNLKLNSKPYRVIKRKREHLDDVIYYEDIAQTNDSILRLVNMSEPRRELFFSKYISDLKAAEEAQKEKEEIARRLEEVKTAGSPATTQPIRANVGIPTAQTTFYFYNPTTVAYGKNEFQKLWGDRQLQENWRLSDARAAVKTEDTLGADVEAIKEDRYDPQYYISKIPTAQTAIDSLKKDRNYAYYQLGGIYKEKFGEYQLAKDKYQTLLENNPEERLILPAKYNLYKIYQELNLNGEAEIAKNNIIANYPDSRYAELLRNPNSNLAKDENSPDAVYESLYEQYECQEYAEVITKTETYIRQFEGEIIVPKFEILKASASGRLYGLKAYKEQLNYIALNYPDTEEGKQAQNIIDAAFTVLENKEFVGNNDSKKFHLIYKFTNATKAEVSTFFEQLNKVIKEQDYYGISTSVDVYDQNTKFVVVHGLNTYDGALGMGAMFEEKYKLKHEYFSIASENYEIIQIHKNLNQYLEPPK